MPFGNIESRLVKLRVIADLFGCSYFTARATAIRDNWEFRTRGGKGKYYSLDCAAKSFNLPLTKEQVGAALQPKKLSGVLEDHVS